MEDSPAEGTSAEGSPVQSSPVEGRRPPVFGRPSPAAARPTPLRQRAHEGTAAYRAEGGDRGALAVRAATVTGLRHRLAGAGGQDAFGWSSASGAVALSVADGVSAVEGSEGAANLAAVAAADSLAEMCDQTGFPGGKAVAVSLKAASSALVAAGWREPATTLVAAVVGEEGRWSVGRVGDSTALVCGSSGWRGVFEEVEEGNGESLVTPATDALPADLTPQTAEGTLGAGEALILLSDGVAGPLLDGPETVAPELAAALADPPDPVQLALLADFQRQGCMDDRTIAGVWFLP